jgi:hypothetical protein
MSTCSAHRDRVEFRIIRVRVRVRVRMKRKKQNQTKPSNRHIRERQIASEDEKGKEGKAVGTYTNFPKNGLNISLSNSRMGSNISLSNSRIGYCAVLNTP